MRTRFELADAVTLFGTSLLSNVKLSLFQIKVLRKIAICRTAALGGHEEVCDSCGTMRYSYNSCGDRHCPKCQAAKQAFWIDELVQKTLPIKHYHLVFTVPHHLNAVCLHNQSVFYNLLFAAVWNTLRAFGYSHFLVLKPGPWQCCTPGVKTFHYTHTSIVLFLLPDIPSMGNGRTSDIPETIYIQSIN